MAAVTVGAREFLEQWATISDHGKPSEDRTGAYLSLASYLKENAATPEFHSCMGQFRQQLTGTILNDAKSGSCDQEALQMFGYCLHNLNFANSFTKEEVAVTVRALCSVIRSESVTRNMCTRALWCLANQSFPADLLAFMVPTIVSTVTEVVTSQRFETSVVDAESLNTFISLHQRCLEAFISCSATWYKAIFALIFCKVPKLQRKALNLACIFEKYLLGNHEVVHWLTKELREHTASTMAKLITEKGQDHCVILNAWAHFITILGRTLHKHGSFLNELLKVVEVGFKHKGFIVQVTAYKAWKALVTNFSLDVGLMTSPKRLKLLLMPLLASAVKDRHEQVENIRLEVWWHLISCLGAKIRDLFQQVCIPFLLFSLGMDPKLDLSQLPTFISKLTTSRPYSTTQPSESDLSTTGNTSLSSTSLDKENLLTPNPDRTHSEDPIEDGMVTPVTERRHSSFLLSLVSSVRSQSSSKKKSGDRYQATPSLEMVLSGCQAVIQFVGGKEELPGSVIKPDLLSLAYLHSAISPDIAQFLIFFLDGVIMYANQYGSRFKVDILKLVIQRVVNAILVTVENALDKDGRPLLSGLLELFHSSLLQERLSPEDKLDVLYYYVSVSPHLLLAPGPVPGQSLWQSLMEDFLSINRTDLNSDTFHSCWQKLVTAAISLPPCLSNFQYLLEQVEGVACSSEGATRTLLLKMWTTVARKFSGYLKKTSDINHGNAINPDFISSRLILRFPFQYLLNGTGDRTTTNSCLGTWKDVYDVVNIHVSLAVKDPNLCAQLICGDLYSAYGQNAKVDSVSLERTRLVQFDIYQNAVAVALQFVASKLNWGSLAQGRREDGAKSIQSLLNLLAWQLATFWDTVQKSSIPLATLTTPYTISDTLSQLYGSFPTAPIIQTATEMLAQPLATLWETMLSSAPSSAVSKPNSKNPRDLHLQVTAVWKSIMTCFQARYSCPYDSTILASLSPLLVVTLGSGKNTLLGPTLSFWVATFDQAEELTYPEKLRETFSQFLKSSKPSVGHHLKLPGFNKEVLSIEDSFCNTNESVSQLTETRPQGDDPSVVLPNSSPWKGVKGSFLNQIQSPIRPAPPTTPERSPAAKSLDDILARSRTNQSVQEGGGEGGRAKKSAPAPALSVRRKLSLTGEDEAYVTVTPPAKKRRLLTEHQKEKLQERSPIPVLYNALDPSQDSSLPFTVDDEQPVPESPTGDDPIIIPESEVSPATPISLKRSGPLATPTSGAKRSLPAEAMDTDAQAEFPSSVGGTKSHSDNSDSQSKTRTPKPLGVIPIPIPKPDHSNGSHVPNEANTTTTSSPVILSPDLQNQEVIVVQDDEGVEETPPLASPTTETPPTAVPPPSEHRAGNKKHPPFHKKDTASSEKTPPLAPPTARHPPKLIPHTPSANPASSSTHVNPPPKLFSIATEKEQSSAATRSKVARPTPAHQRRPHSLDSGSDHTHLKLLDSGVRTTSVANRQIVSTVLPPASREVRDKMATASLSEFCYGRSLPPPPYTTTPLTAPPMSTHSHPRPNSTPISVPPPHRHTQPTPVTVPHTHRHPRMPMSTTVPPTHRHTPPPHVSATPPVHRHTRPSPSGQLPYPSEQPRIGTLVRTPLPLPPSQPQSPRTQLPPPLSHPPILSPPPQPVSAFSQQVYQAMVPQPSPSSPHPITQARFPLPSPPLPHPRHHPPGIPRGLSPTESAFGIRQQANSAIFEKAIQLAQTMQPINQSQHVMQHPQTSLTYRGSSSSRVSTRTTPIALMAVDSENNGGMFVVMRHDVVDNLSPTGTPVMQGGPPGIPFPVPNSSISRKQPPVHVAPSTVRDPVPVPRQHQTAISHPRSEVPIPTTAPQPQISPHLNPFVNPQQVASTAQAVKQYFSGGRTRPRGGHKPTGQDTTNTPLDSSRPQMTPDKPVEPVMVVDLTQQDGKQLGPNVTRSERSVGTGHSKVSNAQNSLPSQTSNKSMATRVVPDIQTPSTLKNGPVELVEDPLVGLSSEKPVQGGAVVEDETSSRPVDHSVVDMEDAMEVGESTSKVGTGSISDSRVPSTGNGVPLSRAFLSAENRKQPEQDSAGELTSTERGWMHYEQVALSSASSLEVVPDSEQADSREGVNSFKEDGSAATDGGENTAEGEELAIPLSLPLPKLPPLPLAPPHSGTQEVSSTTIQEETFTSGSDGSKDLPQDMAAPPATPTQGGAGPSPKATPLGILKHTSQFDTPSSASKGRRVQFANAPVVIQSANGKSNGNTDEEPFKTPKHSRSPRTPQSLFSSRRTLLMPQTPTRMIQVSKSPSTPTTASGTIVYPALADCSSPVEQIVPVLSPSSRFTHGLLQLVHARNIHTVGSISSLTEQQVQMLPIRSPKVETLRNALRNFQQQQLGSKRKNSVDSDAGPSKVPKSTQPASGSGEEKTQETSKEPEATPEHKAEESQLTQSSEEQDGAITLSTPDSQLGGDCEEVQGAGQEVEAATPTQEDTAKAMSVEDDMPTQGTEQLPLSTPSEPQLSETHSEASMEPESVTVVQTSEDLMDADEATEKVDHNDVDDVFEEATEASAAEVPSQDAGKDTETEDEDQTPPADAEVTDGCGESKEDEAAMEVEIAEQLQLPLEEGSQECPTSTVVLDHSYCSQNQTDSALISGEEDRETETDSRYDSTRSKLSSANSDHTYCYSGSSEDIRSELSSSSVVTIAAEVPVQDSTDSAEQGEVIQNAESQELFSYDHHGNTSPIPEDLPSPGRGTAPQSELEDLEAAAGECHESFPDDEDVAISAEYATDYPDFQPPTSMDELASCLDFIRTTLPDLADVASVLENASLEEAYSVHQQLGAIALHCMQLQQLDIGGRSGE